MINAIFGFPSLIDAAALSGGSWTNGALTRIQNRYYRQRAISADLDTANTRLDIALPKEYLIRAICLPAGAHNLTVNAELTVQAATVSDFSVLVSNVTAPVWTSPESDQVDWEADVDYGLYRPTDADIGYRPWAVVRMLPAGIAARYWRLIVSDPANPDGVVQIGRIFIGGGFQLSINPSYGASIGVETGTVTETASSGYEAFRVKEPYRIARFSVDWARDTEAFSRHLEMMLRAGINQEVLFSLYPDAIRDVQRNTFLGRFRRLSPVEIAAFGINAIGYEIKELQ